MRKLGVVGGTGPESTVEYYRLIISRYQEKTGNNEELPEFLIHSINMYKIFTLLDSGQTDGLIDYLAEAVGTLEKAGADFVVLAANTPHIVFDEVQRKAGVPMISIVEASYRQAEEMGLNKIGLLGTKFTMENDFFKKPFLAGGKEILVPDQQDQQYIHRKIVEELEKGIVNEETKQEYMKIATKMIEQDGAEGIVLGCTELPMIFKPEDLPVPQLDTMDIHVNKIVEAMFAERP